MQSTPTAEQAAAAGPAAAPWAYEAPHRPTDYPEQCYYRTAGGINHCIGEWQPDATRRLEVFRFRRDEDLRLTIEVDAGDNTAKLTTRLDAAGALLLRDALNDALHDMAVAAEHKARRDSFERIQDEMRDAGEDGPGCYYAHPDVHYVPGDQVADKVRELEAAGVKQYMVLPHPAADLARAA